MQSNIKEVPGIIEELRKKYDNNRLADSMQLLVKLMENIQSNPSEVKYRKIKTTNPVLEAKVFQFKGIERLLSSLGFVAEGEFYRYPHQDITPINQAIILFRAQEVALRTNEPDDEESKKRKQQIDAELKKKEDERRKIVEQMKNDRHDKKLDMELRPTQASKANDMKFGARMVTRKDLDPNCDDQKGG